ncbi:MAG TPA: SAM-dependent chlorinase/fluorinase [Candidatus Angelobacter sp.]|nr:SAM-dependent chlorinase/fluorinase [Candidatus Angelobacter sp.]
MSIARIVTFTTDFGLIEHYVGAMKGVIYSINPAVTTVDITNAVQSFDLLDGAIAISQAYRYFPKDTIHMVIVDPGVGGPRRPIVATSGQHIFLAPDNGVLSLVYEQEERVSVRHITASHYFLQPVSATFHGRDIFAVIAGYLSKGVDVAKFGEEITDYVRFVTPKPKATGPNAWKGIVLKVDKFGNLITNFSAFEVPGLFQSATPPFKITVGKAQVTRMGTNYVGGAQGEAFAIVGSSGFLEISVNRGSASHLAAAQKGSEVLLAIG